MRKLGVFIALCLIISTAFARYPQPIFKGYLTRGTPNDLLFSHDGRYLVVATSNGIDFLDAQTFQPVRHLLSGENVQELDISADDFLLACLISQGKREDVTLWRLNGDELKEVLMLHDVQGPMALSPDGSKLAVPKERDVSLWDVISVKLIGSLKVKNKRVHDMKFSPDGRYLAVLSSGAWTEIWDVGSMEVTTRIQHQRARYIRFSPDGELLASAEDKVNMWKLPGGELIQTFPDTEGDMAFTPDSLIATVNSDQSLIFRDPLSGEVVGKPIEISIDPYKIAFSPDGRMVAVLGSTVEIWDVDRRRFLKYLDWYDCSPEFAYRITPDGRYLTFSELNRFRVRELQTGRIKYQLMGRFFWWHALTGDGHLAVIPEHFSFQIKFISVETGEVIREVPSGFQLGPRLKVTPDDKELVIYSYDRLYIYDLRAKKFSGTTTVLRLGEPISDLAFSRNGRYLAVAGEDGGIYIWRKAGPGSYKSLVYEPGTPTEVSYLWGGYSVDINDMGIAAYPSYRPEKKVKLLSLGDVVGEFDGYCPRFSPDGRFLLLVNDGSAEIWNWLERERIGVIPRCVAYLLSDSGVLITRQPNGRLAVWDVSDLLKPSEGRGKPSRLYAKANFPNPFVRGTWIPTYHLEGEEVTLRIYDILGRLVRAIRASGEEETVYWDRRNERGERVANGVYFYTLRVGDKTISGKMEAVGCVH
jgi:WD40 repeat protein